MRSAIDLYELVAARRQPAYVPRAAPAVLLVRERGEAPRLVDDAWDASPAGAHTCLSSPRPPTVEFSVCSNTPRPSLQAGAGAEGAHCSHPGLMGSSCAAGF
jgi:hypothetical protein